VNNFIPDVFLSLQHTGWL